jgi:hypothetical protein
VPREIISGEPGTTWTNTTSRAMYQFVPLSNACAACLQYAYQLSNGPWPIPIHRNCRCQQRRVEPYAKAPHPFADFRKMLEEMSHADKVKAIGSSVYNLLERGVVEWEDVVTRYRVRSLKEVVALKKLSLKTLESNGVRPWIAEIAHAAVHTPEQDLIRQARAASMKALEAAGVHQEQLIEVLSKALTGRAQLVGAAPGAMSTTAAFTPKISAQARELEAILAGWRASAAAAIVAVGADSITVKRGAVTTTVRPGETKFGKTFEEWKRIAEEK